MKKLICQNTQLAASFFVHGDAIDIGKKTRGLFPNVLKRIMIKGLFTWGEEDRKRALRHQNNVTIIVIVIIYHTYHNHNHYIVKNNALFSLSVRNSS